MGINSMWVISPAPAGAAYHGTRSALVNIKGLMPKTRNSSALAMELRLFSLNNGDSATDSTCGWNLWYTSMSCISKRWFRKLRVASSVPSHHLTQSWLLVKRTIRNFIENSIKLCIFSVKKMYMRMPPVKWRPSCDGLDVIKWKKVDIFQRFNHMRIVRVTWNQIRTEVKC